MRIQPLGNLLFNAIESPTANEQNILGIDRNHFLVGMLAPTLGRHIHHRTFQQFQQSLLHAFTTHITGYGRIITLARYFVYLIK